MWKNINKQAVARVLSNPNADKARLLGELFIPMPVNYIYLIGLG